MRPAWACALCGIGGHTGQLGGGEGDVAAIKAALP